MPIGPKGQKRPADVVSNAVLVAKLATGEAQEVIVPHKNPHAQILGRAGGKKGGPARAAKLTPEQRRILAQKAANARWAK